MEESAQRISAAYVSQAAIASRQWREEKRVWGAPCLVASLSLAGAAHRANLCRLEVLASCAPYSCS